MTFRCQNGGVELGALLPKAFCRLMAIRRQSPSVRPRECPGDAPPTALISSSNAASDHHPSPSLPWMGWGHDSRRGPHGETETKHGGSENGH